MDAADILAVTLGLILIALVLWSRLAEGRASDKSFEPTDYNDWIA